MIQRSRQSRSLLSCLALQFCLVGCGGTDKLPVEGVAGSVILDGQPLEQAVIRFVPIEGTPGQKTSVPVKAGKFDLPAERGLAVGKHRIEVESVDTAGFALDDEDALVRLKFEGKRRIKVLQIPPRYNIRSQLTREVVAGTLNRFKFELHSDHRR